MTDLFFRFLKGHCHGNQFFAKLAKRPSFGRLAFQNGEEYGSSNFKIFNGNIVTTSCANFIKIGPVTPEIAIITTVPLWMRWQKLAYCNKYLGIYQTDLHQLFS